MEERGNNPLLIWGELGWPVCNCVRSSIELALWVILHRICKWKRSIYMPIRWTIEKNHRVDIYFWLSGWAGKVVTSNKSKTMIKKKPSPENTEKERWQILKQSKHIGTRYGERGGHLNPDVSLIQQKPIVIFTKWQIHWMFPITNQSKSRWIYIWPKKLSNG